MAGDVSIKIIGVGNEWRGDDGAGVAVARALREKALPGVIVLEATGEGAALMAAWQGADVVILVDAVRSGAGPGKIHRFDARDEHLPTDFFHYSTHAFSVAEAVELARVLNRLPPRLIVYGIEGKTYEAGAGLSPEVAQGVEQVVERIGAEVARLKVGFDSHTNIE